VVRNHAFERLARRVVVKNPTCPVCAWEIKDKGHAVKVADKTLVVCCADCAEEVKKNPKKYGAAKK
jgi:hypothetical protein